MGFSRDPNSRDDLHQGSRTPHTPGPRGGFTPELGSIAQAEYSSGLEQEATEAKKGRLARIGGLLRRIFWEF